MVNTVTKQQIDFINILQSERYVPLALIETMRTMWNNGLFTTEAADGYIQGMLQFPQNNAIVTARNQIVGYHKLNNQVYRVYRSKTGSMYVKQLTVSEKGKATMTYVNFDTIRKLNVNTLMTPEASAHIDRLINTKVI